MASPRGAAVYSLWTGHPAPGADDGVVVDPIHGGYYPWAHRPGSEATHHTAVRHAAGGGHSSASRASSALPGVCKDLLSGSTAGTLVAAPSAVIAATPVDCSAAQTATPQQLAQQAWQGMQLPLPDVRTAPPRGAAGLVGLPEWVWVPRTQWRPQAKHASAGGVWAQVTATPKQMIIDPGSNLPATRCHGPGTAYDPVKPASAQRTDCSITYARSSASEPGAVYPVRVTVVWAGTWHGSGGTGGALPNIARSTTFRLPVAEAQGLYG